MTRKEGERYMDPDTWIAAAPGHDGSWWPAWEEWVTRFGLRRTGRSAARSARSTRDIRRSPTRLGRMYSGKIILHGKRWR